jgi:flagellar hook-basal body complex protein FliE
MRIENITQLQNPVETISSPKTESSDDFGKMLTDALREVNQAQLDARKVQEELMAGRKVEYHDLIFAMERAGISMQLTMQVRNKLLEAYQEIQRMQI